MKEMYRGKFIVFAVIVIIGLATRVLGLPAIDGLEKGAVDERVTYDGAQLWRIPYDKQHERNAVADLQNSFGKFRNSLAKLRTYNVTCRVECCVIVTKKQNRRECPKVGQ